MESEIQTAFVQAIKVAVKVIARESTLEQQLHETAGFFDYAAPHYPKRGKIVRYNLSHKNIVEVDLLKGGGADEWNAAAIALGSQGRKLMASESDGCLDLASVKKAGLSFSGVYEENKSRRDRNGKIINYKSKVSRYTYKSRFFVDFILKDKTVNTESYPVGFYFIYIY